MKTYEKVFEFLADPAKETFLKCRELVINDPEYDPYSGDLENIQGLLNEGKFGEVIQYVNVNILLVRELIFINILHTKNWVMKKEGVLK
ncbi:hypothetical protein [Chryseobacterium indologenes]|uniref:hypothetical protein n=1 Tax=Chryseobacterium indologenes TaxID=253 RepID=UPI001BCFCB4D|nr:hypothetical protein [Chryseobacterium indologenes]